MTVQKQLLDLYAHEPDPWGFLSSWYERRKYALTLAALPRERYRAAYEPGCSIGVLTRLLADRCDTLVASDFIPTAVARAREQVADLPHVRVDELVTPREWPVGTFDLIVVSELAYFLQPDEVRELGRLIGGSIEAGGSVVMVHWLGPIDAWALPAAAAHACIADAAGLSTTARLADERFLLEVFAR